MSDRQVQKILKMLCKVSVSQSAVGFSSHPPVRSDPSDADKKFSNKVQNDKAPTANLLLANKIYIPAAAAAAVILVLLCCE